MSDDEFLKLCKQWSQALWCFVRSRLRHGCINCADDAIQESLLRMWRSREKFWDGNFKAFMFTIAKRHCIDIVRGKKPHQTLPDPNLIPAPGKKDIAEELIDKERAKVIAECLEALPQEEAAVWRMRAGGSSNQEIAQALGGKVERVYTLIFQAKQDMMLCVERKLS